MFAWIKTPICLSLSRHPVPCPLYFHLLRGAQLYNRRWQFPPSNLSVTLFFCIFSKKKNRQVVPWNHPQRQLEATATQDTTSYFAASTWKMVSRCVYQQFLLTGTVCSLISPYKLCLLNTTYMTLLAWKPFQICLSYMFNILKKLGLVPLLFKPWLSICRSVRRNTSS